MLRNLRRVTSFYKKNEQKQMEVFLFPGYHAMFTITGRAVVDRGGARGVPGGATAPQNFAWPPQN